MLCKGLKTFDAGLDFRLNDGDALVSALCRNRAEQKCWRHRPHQRNELVCLSIGVDLDRILGNPKVDYVVNKVREAKAGFCATPL